MSEHGPTVRRNLVGASLLVLLPIGLFYATAVLYSLNIPWFDDIENIPYFLLNWLNADTIPGQLSALFRPNNEHRVVGARLVVLVQQALMGELNFRVLAFVGNLSVLGIFALLVMNFRKVDTRILWLLPAALLIFNLQFYAMTFMTIMTLQYQLVIFLSFLAFHFLAKGSNTYFWLAIGVAWLDTFSMGNGMMVWPSGMVLLFFLGRWKELGIWTLLGAGAIFFYFYGYDFVQGNDKGFAYILANPIKVLAGLLAMVGGIFDIFPTLPFLKRMLVPTVMGTLLLGFGLYWLGRIFSQSEYWQSRLSPSVSRLFTGRFFIPTQNTAADAFWLAALTYLFISMALVVFFRTRFDYELVLWSTYKIYPGTFAAIGYLLLISLSAPKTQKFIFGIALLGSLLAWGTSYYHYVPEVASIRKVRQAFAFNQQHNGIGLGASKGTSFEPMVVRTLQGTRQKGVYQLPAPIVHRSEERIARRSAEGSVPIAKRETAETIHITLPKQLSDSNPDRYVVLKSDQNIYLFYISPTQGEASCPKATLHSGEYTVEIWEIGDTYEKLLATDQTVSIR
jgi:hypothetical protein